MVKFQGWEPEPKPGKALTQGLLAILRKRVLYQDINICTGSATRLNAVDNCYIDIYCHHRVFVLTDNLRR